MKTWVRVLLAVVTAWFAFAAGGGTAWAQQPPAGADPETSWSVDPFGFDKGRSNFTYTLKPGQVFQDTLSVTNASNVPLSFDVYAADAYNTPLDAGYALHLRADPREDAAAWVTFGSEAITVPPKTRLDIPFRLAIPLDARPGDHAAGLIAERSGAPAPPSASGVAVQIQRRIAARMYVRVAGPLQPRVEVERIEVQHRSSLLPPLTGTGKATVSYRVRNVGNTRLNGTLETEVTGVLGRRVHRFATRKLADLLPGSTIVVVDSFRGLPPLEHLEAKVTAKASGTRSVASRGFWVASWLLVALLAAIVLGLVLRWRRRRKRLLDDGGDAGPPQAAHDEAREPIPA